MKRLSSDEGARPGKVSRRNPARRVKGLGSLNEEMLAAESESVLQEIPVPATRALTAGGLSLEALIFRRRYTRFIHPSSVSSLRKNHPGCLRAVDKRFLAAVGAGGERVMMSIPPGREIFLLPDHRNSAWGSHCVYLAGPPAIDVGEPLLTYGGKWSKTIPRDSSYVVQVYDWFVDAKDAWMDELDPSYGGQVQDAFELSDEEHTAKLHSAFGKLIGNPPRCHFLVSNFSLSPTAAEELKDCALLLTCSYGMEYWLSPPYFGYLGKTQLMLAVANESRWLELSAFFGSDEYQSIKLRYWGDSASAPDTVLCQLREEFCIKSRKVAISDMNRSKALARNREKEKSEQLSKKARRREILAKASIARWADPHV